MNDFLQIFTQALEEATQKRFISMMAVKPLLKPAYKEVHITMWEMDEAVKVRAFEIRKTYRITSDIEREAAVRATLQDFMSAVLKDNLKA